MIIDFKDLTPNVVQNMRNGEGSVKLVKYADDVNSIVRITISKGSSIGWHIHENDQEIIYVISGKGICIEDDKEYELVPGFANYCAKGKNHSIKNINDEDLELFAVITKL